MSDRDYQERERILVDAAERYLRGEITLEQHNEIRQANRTDYIGMARAIGRARGRRRWWDHPFARILLGFLIGLIGTQLAIRVLTWIIGS